MEEEEEARVVRERVRTAIAGGEGQGERVKRAGVLCVEGGDGVGMGGACGGELDGELRRRGAARGVRGGVRAELLRLGTRGIELLLEALGLLCLVACLLLRLVQTLQERLFLGRRVLELRHQPGVRRARPAER